MVKDRVSALQSNPAFTNMLRLLAVMSSGVTINRIFN